MLAGGNTRPKSKERNRNDFDPSVEARKDLTPAQARRWVRQEAAKHTTRASRLERIASERRTIARSRELALDCTLPNSLAVHETLIAVLAA